MNTKKVDRQVERWEVHRKRFRLGEKGRDIGWVRKVGD
jgi:hypothetical protein